MPHRLDPTILREYDIRGIVGKTLSIADARAIGRSYALVLAEAKGRRGPTRILYYAAATLGVDGGIMVTGSHNPPDHNGFKFVFRGKPFYGAAIRRLGETAVGLDASPLPRGRIAKHAIR